LLCSEWSLCVFRFRILTSIMVFVGLNWECETGMFIFFVLLVGLVVNVLELFN